MAERTSSNSKVYGSSTLHPNSFGKGSGLKPHKLRKSAKTLIRKLHNIRIKGTPSRVPLKIFISLSNLCTLYFDLCYFPCAAFCPAILPKVTISVIALPPSLLVPWITPVTSPAA